MKEAKGILTKLDSEKESFKKDVFQDEQVVFKPNKAFHLTRTSIGGFYPARFVPKETNESENKLTD